MHKKSIMMSVFSFSVPFWVTLVHKARFPTEEFSSMEQQHEFSSQMMKHLLLRYLGFVVVAVGAIVFKIGFFSESTSHFLQEFLNAWGNQKQLDFKMKPSEKKRTTIKHIQIPSIRVPIFTPAVRCCRTPRLPRHAVDGRHPTPPGMVLKPWK